MKITRFAISHAVTVYVLIAAIFIGGLFAYFDMPREAAPDIPIPFVIVSTPYFGVSPADIETLVTQPIERELSGLRDLRQMTSTSAESVSLVTLEFEPDVNIEDALQRVRTSVDQARPDLPSDAEEPEVIEINASDWPILVANVSGDMDPVRLQDLAEEMQDDIESIRGVLEVSLAGGIKREIHVDLHPEKLRHHDVSPNEVIQAIQTENVNLPGGSMDIGSMTYIVRVAGEFAEIEPMNHIIVATNEGEPVYLRDVATVVDDFEERTTYSRLTTWQTNEAGERVPVTKPNISLAIVKRAGDNIISVAEQAREVIEDYELRAAGDIEISIVSDMSTMIEDTVHDLENNLITGMLLVLIVLFLFMGGARNAIFVAMSVPLSMLITILVLAMMGVTLNMVVLFALLLALGMLVDNAIVVVENIYRHASAGKDLATAAIDGTTEVGWAIIAATSTTVAAFFPMLFWPGIMGEFMGFLPLTVIIALLSSLFVALVINPTLCATLMRVKDDNAHDEESVPNLLIYRAYRGTLNLALDHRWKVTFLSVAALVGTFMAYGELNHGVEFFPETTPEQFSVELTMPDGTNLDATDSVLTRMQPPLAEEPDLVTAWITDTGTRGGGQAGGGGSASHYGQITVELKPIEDQPSDPRQFMDYLRKVYQDIPDAEIVLQMQDMGPPTGAPIALELSGEDLETLADLSSQIRQRVRTISGVTDLTDDIELSRPEIHVEIDRQRAAILGLSTDAVAQTVRTAVAGTEAGVIREADDEFDILVRLGEAFRNSPEQIRQLTVVNNDGFHIPLEEVAEVVIRGGSGSIRRSDEKRVVTISGNVADGFLPPLVREEIERELFDFDIPAGYELRVVGEQEDMDEATDFLTRALMAALFLIALILVTEFNSLVQPFLILISVTLSLIGVLWALILTGLPFGVIMTGIGIISLSGVVVNNSIVLIDYINQLRERGYDRREAIIRGGLVRFRPVALTAVTTILGLAPIVMGVSLDFVNGQIVFGGTSVEMWGGMANAVVFGLLVATVLTLVVIPVMYSLLDGMSQFGKRILSRISAVGLVATMILIALPAIASGEETAPSVDEETQLEQQEPLEQQEQLEQKEQLQAPDEASLEVPPRELDELAQLTEMDIPVERTLTLDQARQLVVEEHYDVQLAQTQVRIADGIIRQAYGAVLPTFSASANYIINQEERTADFGGDMDNDLPPGFEFEFPETVIQPKTDYRWSLSATLTANFRAYPRIRQAYVQRDLAQTEVEVLREALDEAVIQSYFNVLVIRRSIDLSTQQVESADTLYQSVQRRRDAGTATEFELTRAELELHQRTRQLETAILQFIQARQALAELLQTDPDFDIRPPDSPALPDDDQPLVERAEQGRAIFTADEFNEEIAEWGERDIWFSYLPSLSATFSYGGGKGTDLQPGDPQWTLTFGAEWIIWDGGMREAELDQARARTLATQIQSQKTRHEIDSQLEQALSEVDAARTQVESAEVEVELAARSLHQAETSFRYGVASQLDVITARDQYQLAQLSLIQQQLQVDLSVYRVLSIMGGLDE